MNKSTIVNFFKAVRTSASKHSPEILTGLGIAGMITTTVLAVKATPKALQLIEEAEVAKIDSGDEEPLTKVEVVKVAWKPYVPALVLGTASTACLIGASSVSLRRNAALATAYQLSTTALNEYKEKVVETIGEKKDEIIKDKIAKDKVEKNPIGTHDVIITGKGTTLCYDAQFGKYFESDIETIRRSINNINYKLTTGQYEYVSLNELYAELNIPRIDIGDDVGWNIGRDGQVEVDFSAQIADDGRPCIVMQYQVAPRYEYHKLM